MKYILVLGIEYKKYKKPAEITIQVGGKFVDSFELNDDSTCNTNILQHIESKWFEKYDKLYFLNHPHWIKDWADIPSLLKVYEIDDSAIVDKLEIKVRNSDSNYSNGFMNKSSLIKFPIVTLFKKDLLKNRGEQMARLLFGHSPGRDLYDDIEPEQAWKKKVHPWPNTTEFKVYRDNEIHEKSGMKNKHWWIGGDFTAEFIIKTKHRTKYLASASNEPLIGFPHSSTIENIIMMSYTPLLNIYDED